MQRLPGRNEPLGCARLSRGAPEGAEGVEFSHSPGLSLLTGCDGAGTPSLQQGQEQGWLGLLSSTGGAALTLLLRDGALCIPYRAALKILLCCSTRAFPCQPLSWEARAAIVLS